MTLPEPPDEIVQHAEELAAAFEAFEPTAETGLDPDAYNGLRAAALARAQAERAVADAVANARLQGFSWALIGTLIGTSGAAARQRYG